MRRVGVWKGEERKEKEKETGKPRNPGKWQHLWLLLSSVAVLHGLAILVFIRGFLLTRTELPYTSRCSDVSHSPCSITSTVSSSYSSPNLSVSSGSPSRQQQHQRCWTKPAVDRVVIIVLDAIRFDFVAPSTFFEESKPWMDRLPVLRKWASKEGSMARIFKAIADPPTTSLQRLKGLATGGLPTFIDVGNSFGAPAILEDNFIQQLVQNDKRVVMMGDDTWTQLFPHRFKNSYPYPSFNVKDLHTVDNGCIEHLIPSLYKEDWDVLIAHFLGVDHAGHIFGVDSSPMIEKLEQYNNVLEKVIEVLEGESGPGGLHENTLLLVMGDHGQTLNGDHGGGSPEEVETSLFAMNFKKLPSPPIELDEAFCKQDLDGKKICISSIQQLDFAVTVSALLGIPFPFGSIGRVNRDLYALGASKLDLEGTTSINNMHQSRLEEWMQNYVNVLCVNSWQVKRYIDIYSASSLIGFSADDILHVSDIYTQAKEEFLSIKNEPNDFLLPAFKRQIDLYSNFLSSVSELARSKWTEFNLKMMGIGFGVMLLSLTIQFLAIKRMYNQSGVSLASSGDLGISFGLIFSCFIVAVRACSFLSNSYILEEGKVAIFLLATTGILKLRYSVMKEKVLLEAVLFLFVVTVCRFMIEVGLSKQGATSLFLKANSSWVLWIASVFPVWTYIAEVVPLLILLILIYLLYRAISCRSYEGIPKYIIIGTILSYMLIAVQWASESKLWRLAVVFDAFGRDLIPRTVYAIVLGQLSVLVFCRLNKDKLLDYKKSLIIQTVSMLSALSSIIILLSGKQGPLVALASIIGGNCIMRLSDIEQDAKHGIGILSIMQWNLFAVCLFFCSGHWCAFDGLRYGAAFIGFDEFVLIRQAILLTIDTFGFSHILPIFGVPLLLAQRYIVSNANPGKQFFLMKLTQVYLIYGLIMATTVTAMMLCVAIHRRHLMVWGLFAPKFVFDVVGLILADVLICLASIFYCRQVKDDGLRNQIKENESHLRTDL